MAFILSDRVKETTTTTGTGAVTLGGAVSGFEAFSARMSNGDTTRYAILGTTEWEVGIGTWNTGGTLTRTTVLKSSNSDSAVSFSTGTKTVFMTLDSTFITGIKTTADAAYTPGGTDVAVADGGTGASTLTGILKGNGTSAITTVTAPSGTIVGTTDTQTLTNKDISSSTNTMPLRNVFAGSFASPGATGNKSVTGVGFKPRKVRFVAALSTGTNTLYNEGVMDAAGNQWAWASAARNGVGAQSVAPSTTRCLLQYDLSAGGVFTKEQEAHYVSMDSDGFTINFDTSTGAGVTILFFAEA